MSRSGSNAAPVRRRRDESSRDDKRDKSRWGADRDKALLPGLATILPANLDSEQLELYLLQVRIEELTMRLKNGDVFPPAHRPRSPSPPPEYGYDGRRSNLPEQRYRQRIEDERQMLIDIAVRRIPGYTPAAAPVAKGQKLQEKLYIPARDFPEINFVGPRGNTLKGLEADSGAKISIRGKGSVKEGKIGPTPGEEEELHALVMADTDVKIKKAMSLINKIIETAASVPEGQNELKRLQLRQLAELNGTAREDDSLVCTNCGETGHRKFDCPEAENVTANLVCKICGGIGHVAIDCLDRNNPEAIRAAEIRASRMDSEYANLMGEVGSSSNEPVAPWKQAAAAPPWASAAANPPAAPPGFSMPPPGFGAPGFFPPPPGAGFASLPLIFRLLLLPLIYLLLPRSRFSPLRQKKKKIRLILRNIKYLLRRQGGTVNLQIL